MKSQRFFSWVTVRALRTALPRLPGMQVFPFLNLPSQVFCNWFGLGVIHTLDVPVCSQAQDLSKVCHSLAQSNVLGSIAVSSCKKCCIICTPNDTGAAVGKPTHTSKILIHDLGAFSKKCEKTLQTPSPIYFVYIFPFLQTHKNDI